MPPILRRGWQEGWLPALLLVAGIVLAYQSVWQAGFIWDDDRYVTRNPLLIAPDGLKRIWFSLDAPSQYCPLVYTSFRLERPFWGLDASGYHWVNLLLHAANAILLWRLLQRLAVPGAWLAAAFFALHPVQVESVAWISERKNLLSLCGCLFALWYWLDFIEGRRRRLWPASSSSSSSRQHKMEKEPGPESARTATGVWGCYTLALIFYGLALCSKTTACTLPAALVLVLWLQHQPVNARRWLQIAPFVGLGVAMGLLTMWWERHHQGTSGHVFAIGWLERLLIASRAPWFYAGKLWWPMHLCFSYPRWQINPTDPLAYAWLAASGALGAAILCFRRYCGRALETGVVFFVTTLSPLLGFIMLYTLRYSFVADHYQYVACIGLLALAAAALTKALAWLPAQPWLAWSLSGLLLASLGVLTWRQGHMYVSAETLWRATIAQNPGSYLAHNNLGTTLWRQGRNEEAVVQFQQVLQLQPDYEIAHYDLGQALLGQGLLDDAIAQFQKAVDLAPDYANAHNNLANALVRKGRLAAALAHYQAALNLRPSADFANNLAWLLATAREPSIRNGPKAIDLARLAEHLSAGRNPVFIATQAAAYAESGRFAEATATAQRALDLAWEQRNAQMTEVLSQHLALYQAGQPVRDAAPAQTGPP